MKKLLLVLGVLFLAVALWLLFRPGPGGPRFATPGECVQAYFEAVKTGDTAKYLHCLAPDLRDDRQQQFASTEALAEFLRSQGEDLRNFGSDKSEINGDQAIVWEDLTFSKGKKRQKITLQKTADSWHITGLEPAQDVPQEVPYGTHISKMP